MSKLKDLTGETFGNLTVLSRVENDRLGKSRWLCLCSCGNTLEVRGNSLSTGNTKSCGCQLTREFGAAGAHATYLRYKHSAKHRNYSFELTEEKAIDLFLRPCFYCGEPPSNLAPDQGGGTFVYNGIDRVVNALGYSEENCVPCCSECNRAKGTRDADEWLDHVIRVFKNLVG